LQNIKTELENKNMDWVTLFGTTPLRLGLILFFLAPLVIWVIVFLIAGIKNNYKFKFFGLIVGNDNRLSLSKLQALAWTLVIFGSYFAAMAVHKPINPNVQLEADSAKNQAEIAVNKVKSLATDLELAKTNLATATQEKTVADKAYTEAKDKSNKLEADATATSEAKESAKTEAAKKAEELSKKTTNHNNASKNLEEVQKSISDAEKSAQTAKEYAETTAKQAFSESWIDIPLVLLALAGIAIGSGVFSSLISAVNGEKQTAEITSIKEISAADFNNRTNSIVSNSNNLLKLVGNNFGTKKGSVRFGQNYRLSQSVPILDWNSNGNEIIVDVTSDVRNILIIDTTNGKLTYQLKNSFIVDSNEEKKLLDELKVAEQKVKQLETTKAVQEKALSEAEAKLKEIPDDAANQTAKEEAQQAVNTWKQVLEPYIKADKDVENLKMELRKFDKNDVLNLRLDEETSSYEFADLFRDDKNPINLDLMKFQMFGWNLIAIFIYSWLFLQHLTDSIISLPLVPDTIAILTGVSQTGYLASKGVSGIKPNNS
jgi:hypothetical protein